MQRTHSQLADRVYLASSLTLALRLYGQLQLFVPIGSIEYTRRTLVATFVLELHKVTVQCNPTVNQTELTQPASKIEAIEAYCETKYLKFNINSTVSLSLKLTTMCSVLFHSSIESIQSIPFQMIWAFISISIMK